VYLLGLIDFDHCLALQQRLVYEQSGRRDGQVSLLICEHPDQITVGRNGSWGHIHLNDRQLQSRRLEVRWVSRGGGCVLHSPGQLAVYPIMPLEPRGLTVGQFMSQFQAGLLAAVEELGIQAHLRPGRHGIWGRTGHLVSLGVSVKSWVTYHGAFVNVAPASRAVRFVETDPWDGAPASSLAAERHQPVKMSRVREALVRGVAQALAGDRFHVYSGHPLLAHCRGRASESAARVG
jgi:lipoyl(octanoyl) transferase